jgi:hypothetical protein
MHIFLTMMKVHCLPVSCILGKHNKQHFHDSTFRACTNIELIHFDLCGPMSIPFAFGNKYIMIFIDDYTRMCWVYLLKL